jgi:hypothetical protein
MYNTRLLRADNRYHQHGMPLAPSSGFGNEFDYDDPEIDFLDDEETKTELPDVTDDLRYLRDFILQCALYINELEMHAGYEDPAFWEAREHAYQIVTSLLVDVYR